MSSQLTETLWKLHRERSSEYGDSAPEWVFLSSRRSNRNNIEVDNWRRDVFIPSLKKAEMRHFRIHDIRHTYASLLLQAGESMVYVKEQMGHSAIKMTVDVYGHLIPGG